MPWMEMLKEGLSCGFNGEMAFAEESEFSLGLTWASGSFVTSGGNIKEVVRNREFRGKVWPGD